MLSCCRRARLRAATQLRKCWSSAGAARSVRRSWCLALTKTCHTWRARSVGGRAAAGYMLTSWLLLACILQPLLAACIIHTQELSFYRTLGSLLQAVQEGASYRPLTDGDLSMAGSAGLTSTPDWSPLATQPHSRGAGTVPGLPLSDAADEAISSSSGDSSSRVVAAAAAARLRSALQRLCSVGSSGRMAGAGKQPLWLYINHLGWCR